MSNEARKDFLVAYPYVEYEDEFGISITQRSTLYIKLVQEMNDDPMQSVFVIGEALCAIDDNFEKSEGRRIAKQRADYHEFKEYAELFTLAEALETEHIEEEPTSCIKSPLTGIPLPPGIVKRLPSLLETHVEESLLEEASA